jgi:hypothetical protein
MYQIPRRAEPLVGRIEYLDSKGSVVNFTNYDDADDFVQDIKDELEWYVAIVVTLYRDATGATISTDFICELKSQPVDIRVEEAPTLVRI